MKAGKRDRRVQILRWVEGAQDDFGEDVPSWTPAETVWAEKLVVSDAERVKAQAAGVVVTVRLRVCWSSVTATLTPRDRFNFEARTYGLVGEPKEVGRREGIELTLALINEVKA